MAETTVELFRISEVEAIDLPDFDKKAGGGASDPYVVFSLETAERAAEHRSHTHRKQRAQHQVARFVSPEKAGWFRVGQTSRGGV